MTKLNLIVMSAGFLLGLSPLWAQATEPTKQEGAGQAAQAQMWTGTLADAECKAKTPDEKCEITPATKEFLLQTADGKFVKLHTESHAKVKTAVDSSPNKTGAIKVSMSGAMDGEVLKVEAVKLD